MSIKKSQLQKNLDEYVKAEEYFKSKLLSLESDNITGRAKTLWEEVFPLIKMAIERKMKDSSWDQKEFQIAITEKVMTSVFDGTYLNYLSKL